jgi:hypothetical protein
MSGERVPFPPLWSRGELFYEVRRTALEMSDRADTPTYVAEMLSSLKDCEYLGGKQDHEGATFKSIAYAGRLYGLDAVQRQRWIETAEALGLPQRCIGHIIARADDREKFSEKPRAPQRQLRLVEGGREAPEPRFAVGETVKHEKFGVGEVVESRASTVVVRFADGHERVFVPEVTPMHREGA